jgi:hypothetical protein
MHNPWLAWIESLQTMTEAWMGLAGQPAGPAHEALRFWTDAAHRAMALWTAPGRSEPGPADQAAGNPWTNVYQAWQGVAQAWMGLAGQPPDRLARQAVEYWTDAAQRTVLLWDTLRRRGNIYLEHEQRGKPPVLSFEYEMLLDGRTLTPPSNYFLVRILPGPEHDIDDTKRPFVIFDPRAGHGPGVGGSKADSQIGVALRAGHPCYFVGFYPDPVPGQTLSRHSRKYGNVFSLPDPGSSGSLRSEEVGACHARARTASRSRGRSGTPWSAGRGNIRCRISRSSAPR